jgi:hypothetical protein
MLRPSSDINYCVSDMYLKIVRGVWVESELNVREQQVAFLFERLRKEGARVEEQDRIILNTYVKGSLSGIDLLAHACQFAQVSSYRDWMLSRDPSTDEKSRLLSVAQVLESFYDCLKNRS